MSSTVKTVAKNATAFLSTTAWARGLRFVVLIFAAKIFGPTIFGQVVYLVTIGRLLVLVNDLGISRYCVQQLSRNTEPASEYVSTTLAFNAFMGVLLSIGFYCYFAFEDPRQTMAAFALPIGLSFIFETMTGTLNGLFQAHQKMVKQSVLHGVVNLVMACVELSVLFLTRNALLYAYVFLLREAVKFTALLIFSFATLKEFKFKPQMRLLPGLLKGGIPFGLFMVFVNLNHRVDSYFVDLYFGSAMVGYYLAAYRLLDFPLLFIQQINVALFPAMSRLSVHGPEEMRRMIHGFLLFTFIAVFPFVALISSFSGPLIHLIYGADYAQGSGAFRILVYGVGFALTNTVLSLGLRAVDRQVSQMWVTGIGVLLNIGLNALLVPRYSIQGASVATLASEIMIFLTFTWLLHQDARVRFESRQLFRMGAVLALQCALMIGFLAYGEFHGVLIGLPIYFAAIWKSGFLRSNEIVNKVRAVIQARLNRKRMAA